VDKEDKLVDNTVAEADTIVPHQVSALWKWSSGLLILALLVGVVAYFFIKKK